MIAGRLWQLAPNHHLFTMNHFTTIVVLVASLVAQRPCSASGPYEAAMHSTVKIANAKSNGSGFVVSISEETCVLVTAAHVMTQAEGDECRLVSRQRMKDGQYKRKEIAIRIREAGKPLWNRHPKADIAVVMLDVSKSEFIETIPYSQLLTQQAKPDAKLQLSDEVWVVGYPAQAESGEEGFGILRRGTVASFPVNADRKSTFLIDTSTAGGDSGAPVLKVLRNEKPSLRIAGLVIAQQRETSKTVSPFEERVFHHPLNLAVAVHSQLIVETIDKAVETDSSPKQ